MPLLSSGRGAPGEQVQWDVQPQAPQRLEMASPGLPWGMCDGGSLSAAPWGPQSHSLTLHLFMCPVGVRAAGQGPWGHAWGVQIRGKAHKAGS